MPTAWLTPDVEYWLAGYGIKVWKRGAAFTNVRVNDRDCNYLQEDKSCGRQAIKPEVCKGWPYRPSDLETVERCGYSFGELRAPGGRTAADMPTNGLQPGSPL